MFILCLAVLLNLAAPAGAQNTLELPDVTLFGEYTLYLPAPEPKKQPLPAPAGLRDLRLAYPLSLFRVQPSLPDPPGLYWQRIPGSPLTASAALPEPFPASPLEPPLGAGQPPASAGWQAGIDYFPAEAVVSGFNSTSSSGVWDMTADLRLALADGWVRSPPDSTTDVLFGVQIHRRAEMLNFDAGLGLGAFYDAEASALFLLDLLAGLHGELGVLRWGERMRILGISGMKPPVDGEGQRGAVQQDLELALSGSSLDLTLRAAGILAAGLSSLDAEQHGRLSLELGWRHPGSRARVWAGAAALYTEQDLALYPSGGLELYPAPSLSMVLRGAPFVRLPEHGGFRALCAFQALETSSGPPQLQAESGYSLYSELRIDPLASFGAAVSFEWLKGRIYYLDAAVPELRFADTNQGVLGADLLWRIRADRPAVRLNLTGAVAVALPISAARWPDTLYDYAGVIWTTDFHKLPVEFIIKTLVGDYADDGSEAFLFTDWRLFSGLVTSIEGNWKIGKRSALHTGFEAILLPDFSYRFLIGYGVRR